MNEHAAILRRHAARVVALVAIGLFYWLARLPHLSADARSELAARFAFTELTLPNLPGYTQQSIRTVHPDLAHIDAWISSVGAAVALNDLDGDGLANDLCAVDSRIDQVVVAPAPGTGSRYSSFALAPTEAADEAVATVAPMGCLPGDLNEDGLMDLVVYYWGRTPLAFLRRSPASSSTLGADHYVVQNLIPGPERWFTNAATLADLDGDGHLDLVVGNYFPDGAEILDAQAVASTEMQDSMSRAANGGHNRILLWSAATAGPYPGVHFVEAEGILAESVARGWTLAVGAADLDGDLLPELYFANDFGPDHLLHNRSQPGEPAFVPLHGRKGFTTPASKVLGHDSFKGMGVDFGDLNDDGRLDLVVSNIASEYALEESHFAFLSAGDAAVMWNGRAPYVDASEDLGLARSGWGWDVRLADFDNDSVLEVVQATGFVKGKTNGWPELHELAMGNDTLLHFPHAWPDFRPGVDLSGHQHNPFFVRAADGRYADLAEEVGLNRQQVSRGIAIADVDGDGDLDLAVANQWEPLYFYRNDCTHCGAFLGLHLLLPAKAALAATAVWAGHPGPRVRGRPAVGATAVVHHPDGRRLVAQVDGGNGHSGKRSSELHIGLGHVSAARPLTVELAWRDRTGSRHREQFELRPGWHTVLLADGQ